jgi:MoaA/NifB/PqqE/SkfB family radical SAM enzyme
MKKIVAVAAKVLESKMQLSDIQILQIEPTTYCNARCPHCPRFDSSGNLHPDLKLGHLSIDTIADHLELDQMINLRSVILEGDKGDPIMHPAIEKIIETFSHAPSQPEIVLITNGSIRSPTWWKQLAQKNYSNLNVVFSIDGLEDTNHLYRVGLDYKTIMANVESFISAGGHARWKFILFKHNEHQLDEITELSKNLGFEELIYVPGRSGSFEGQSSWPVTINGEVSHYLEPSTNPRHGSKLHRPRKIKQVTEVKHNKKLCPNLAVGQIYITYLGQVIPCCMMHFDTTLNYAGTKKLREMTGGFDKQDLNLHTMSTILNNQFFNHELENNLKNGSWHLNCARSCKSQILNKIKHVQSKI